LKAVILAGGLGTRIREESEFRPKPMVEIGGLPIIWHIMKLMSVQNINDFVVCLGYKGVQIKNFFLNYGDVLNDVTVTLGEKETIKNSEKFAEKWRVSLVDTGLNTMTGGRIHRVQDYVGNEKFLCTYGDGVADIDIGKLLDFHNSHGKIATITVVKPTNRFGEVVIDENETVNEYSEKPQLNTWINGGFFIFEPKIFGYLDSECILEREPLKELARIGELKAYRHKSYWQPMDTYRESQELNKLWSDNKAPWKNW
jgi:glucose-1-phosphate cytidylyltransferase